MRKELLLSAGLVFASISGACSSAPDLAANLKLRCGANAGANTVSQSAEMVPGQDINIGGRRFNLTGRGYLRYAPNLYASICQIKDGIIEASNSSDRYHVAVKSLGDGGKVEVNVSVNCNNPSQEP